LASKNVRKKQTLAETRFSAPGQVDHSTAKARRTTAKYPGYGAEM
jgi:hypothetical protein